MKRLRMAPRYSIRNLFHAFKDTDSLKVHN